ncbi:unnamed protein product [Larinioides sclopetarius]|uniref:SOCS box domain-containing protein n=1 Tax=Larinioides sclopetarius TaxID=280406 RepID=A0AAV2BGZ6_9ARAC
MNLQETSTPVLRRGCSGARLLNSRWEPLDYNRIILKDVTSIARLSSIVHYSINHLDLSVCETSQKRKGCQELPSNKSFIITEEDCKRVMIPKRTLLNKLHLDFPRILEMRLKKVPPYQFNTEIFYDVDSFHLRDIYLRDEFYLDLLRQFLVECIKNSNKKVETIRKHLKTIKKFFGDLISFHPELFSWILRTIYKECDDSQVIKEVLLAFDFKKWVFSHYLGCNPELLDFFLYHARRSGYIVRGHYPRGDLINTCIMYKKYKIVAVLLKFINAPHFMKTDFRFNTIRRPKLLNNNRRNPILIDYYRGQPARERRISMQRNFLALMILDLFENLPSDEGVLALRLLWRAIADSFFTLSEWMLAFGNQLDPEILQQVDKFYSEIIEEDTSLRSPRTLQQHCRVTIRKTLYDCQKLPNGIELLNLDSRSKAFLRLEN